jgi:hypothetical protein
MNDFAFNPRKQEFVFSHYLCQYPLGPSIFRFFYNQFYSKEILMTHPKFNPIAAFSFIICCCGVFWGIITYFQLCEAVNKATGRDTAKGWTIFVPVYHGLEMSKVIAEVNGLIDQHGVETAKVDDSALINILFYPVPFHNLLKAWGDIADKLNAQGA